MSNFSIFYFMPEISLSFIHPTDGRVLSVTVDDSMTVQETIGELIGADFIPPSPQGYNLAIKGGAALQNAHTLAAGGVKDGNALRIIIATDAG